MLTTYLLHREAEASDALVPFIEWVQTIKLPEDVRPVLPLKPDQKDVEL